MSNMSSDKVTFSEKIPTTFSWHSQNDLPLSTIICWQFLTLLHKTTEIYETLQYLKTCFIVASFIPETYLLRQILVCYVCLHMLLSNSNSNSNSNWKQWQTFVAYIIIIIERKDLGGVMSKRLQRPYNAKNSSKTRVRRKVITKYL